MAFIGGLFTQARLYVTNIIPQAVTQWLDAEAWNDGENWED